MLRENLENITSPWFFFRDGYVSLGDEDGILIDQQKMPLGGFPDLSELPGFKNAFSKGVDYQDYSGEYAILEPNHVSDALKQCAELGYPKNSPKFWYIGSGSPVGVAFPEPSVFGLIIPTEITSRPLHLDVSKII
jgi:hypothetical protein